MVQKDGERKNKYEKIAITKPYSTPIVWHKLHESVCFKTYYEHLLPNQFGKMIFDRQRWTALYQEVTHIDINAHLLHKAKAKSAPVSGWKRYGVLQDTKRIQCRQKKKHYLCMSLCGWTPVPNRVNSPPTRGPSVQASWSHVVSGTRFWLISPESSSANRPAVSCRISFSFFSVCCMLWWYLPMINVYLMESCTFHPLLSM